MLRRTFLRLLAAIPALPFVGRAKGVEPITIVGPPTGGRYTLYQTRCTPLPDELGGCAHPGTSITFAPGDLQIATTYVWSESRQKFVRLDKLTPAAAPAPESLG